VKIYALTFLLYFIFTPPSPGQSTSNEMSNPISNDFGFTIEVGGIIPNTDYKTAELDISGRLLLEYFFSLSKVSSLGIRFSGSVGKLSGSDFSNDFVYPPVPENYITGFFSAGGGLVFAHSIGSSVPYFSFLVSGIFFNPLDENGYKLPNNQYSVYDKAALLYTFETGLRFPFSENWSFNLSLNYNISVTDYLDDIKANSNNDAFFGIYTGISFYFDFENDSDNDGVEDENDLCPETPENVVVDEFGCTIMDSNTYLAEYDSSKDQFISNGIFTDNNLFCFQVEILENLDKAESLKERINAKGNQAYILTVDIGNKLWYSVRIGNFNSFDAAVKYRNDYYKNLIND